MPEEPINPKFPPSEQKEAPKKPNDKLDWLIFIFCFIYLGLLVLTAKIGKETTNPPNITLAPFTSINNLDELTIQELKENRTESVNWLDTQPAKTNGQIYKENIGSVVLLAIVIEGNTRFSGSGVVIKSEKYGYCVLTAAHLFKKPFYSLDENSVIISYFKGVPLTQQLKFLKFAKKYDAALLQFSDTKFVPQKYAVIGQSSLLNTGSEIFLIGSSPGGTFWLSVGSLYTPARKIGVLGTAILSGSQRIPDWPTILIMNISVFQGFSGGPVFNKVGDLIGITVGFYSLTGGLVGVALPIDDLRKDFNNDF
jgi:hypothetical protein